MIERGKHWDTPTLAEIGLPRTPNVDPSNHPTEIFELYSVPSFSLNEPEIVPGSAIGSTKQLVEPGDVLLCKIVPHLVRVWCVPNRSSHRQIASSEWIVVRPNSAKADKDYLRYALIEPGFRNQFMETVSGVGGSLLRARPKAVAQLKVPLPAKAQQLRIVTKLDRLFNHSKSARANLTRVPSLVERYRLAILAASFRGDETADWRTAHPTVRSIFLTEQATGIARKREGGNTAAESSKVFSLPRSWRSAPVESIGEVILGRQRSPENHSGPNMRPYVRAANITWDGWDLSDVKQMNFDERDFKKFKLQPGDVLINEGSGSADEVGKPAIWNGEVENCCFQNTLIAVRPQATTSEYLYFVLLNAALSRAFVDETRGVNIHHIGRAGLAQFVIPVPPAEEQQEMVRRIKAAFKSIDKLVAETSRAAQLLDRLDQATLAKAFHGELVSGAPNDEPAALSLRPAASSTPSMSKRNLIASRRRPIMSAVTPESVVEAIRTLPHRNFTFDVLCAQLPGDYERLKDIVFDLLSQPQPRIIQQFDPQVKLMRFRKVS